MGQFHWPTEVWMRFHVYLEMFILHFFTFVFLSQPSIGQALFQVQQIKGSSNIIWTLPQGIYNLMKEIEKQNGN